MKLRDWLSECLVSVEYEFEKFQTWRAACERSRQEGYEEGYSAAKLKYSIEAYQKGCEETKRIYEPMMPWSASS